MLSSASDVAECTISVGYMTLQGKHEKPIHIDMMLLATDLHNMSMQEESVPQEPGAKLGTTGRAFVKQLSMRLRATVGLPPMKPVKRRHEDQAELGPNPALDQAQQAIQQPGHTPIGS